jgi:hypothetical protein
VTYKKAHRWYRILTDTLSKDFPFREYLLISLQNDLAKWHERGNKLNRPNKKTSAILQYIDNVKMNIEQYKIIEVYDNILRKTSGLDSIKKCEEWSVVQAKFGINEYVEMFGLNGPILKQYSAELQKLAIVYI